MTLKKLLLASSLILATSGAFASDCTVTVDSNDAMLFNTKEVVVDTSCEEFTVTLTHSGKLPVNVMGHNWVLTKTADVQPVARDGIAAGLPNNYLKPDDARVIAATKMIGGGESTSVTFAVGKLSAGEKYTFFCSYPGHQFMMSGVVTLK